MTPASKYATQYKAYRMIRIHLQREKRVVEMAHGLDNAKTSFRKSAIDNCLNALEYLKPAPLEQLETVLFEEDHGRDSVAYGREASECSRHRYPAPKSDGISGSLPQTAAAAPTAPACTASSSPRPQSDHPTRNLHRRRRQYSTVSAKAGRKKETIPTHDLYFLGFLGFLCFLLFRNRTMP